MNTKYCNSSNTIAATAERDCYLHTHNHEDTEHCNLFSQQPEEQL